MRKMTLESIQEKIASEGASIDLAVARFREQSQNDGWNMSRVKPRSEDEIKALDHLSRRMLRTALLNGSVIYNKERRELIVEQYTRS